MAINKTPISGVDAANEFLGWVDHRFLETESHWTQCLLSREELASADFRSEEFRRKSRDLYRAALITLGLSELSEGASPGNHVGEEISKNIYVLLSKDPEVYHYVRDFIEHGPGTKYYDEIRSRFPAVRSGWELAIICRTMRQLDLDFYSGTRQLGEDTAFMQEMSSLLLRAGMTGYWHIFLSAFDVRDAESSAPKPPERRSAGGFLRPRQLALAAALAVIVSILLGVSF